MATDQTWGKSKTVLSKDFTDQGTGIMLTAGTELNVVGKSSTEFQCLVSPNHLIWVPYNVTEKK